MVFKVSIPRMYMKRVVVMCVTGKEKRSATGGKRRMKGWAIMIERNFSTCILRVHVGKSSLRVWKLFSSGVKNRETRMRVLIEKEFEKCLSNIYVVHLCDK